MMQGDASAMVGHQLGAYQLEAPLPIGGVPECFKARHSATGLKVAVKLLPSILAGERETLRTLREEARRIATLRHPNILPIYRFAETQGILYAVTPLPVESLRDPLDREGRLPTTQAIRLAAQLAWALHALHGIGIAHGDVRPGTLLFDARGALQLADFGVARAFATRTRTRPRVSSYTWLPARARGYVAPEVAQTGEVSVRADIYALGAVLYEMLTGTLPHQPETPDQPGLLAPLLPLSTRSSATGLKVATIALKALAYDPDERYPDARAFAVALHRAMIGETESPKQPALLDVLDGVWHPKAKDQAGTSNVEAFKYKLAIMSPASAAVQQFEPAFTDKVTTSPFSMQAGYTSPAELTQALVGSGPRLERRLAATLAGLLLVVALGVGTRGILSGFGSSAPSGSFTTRLGAMPTASGATTSAPTATATTAVVPTATRHPQPAPPPRATTQPVLPPPRLSSTATPRPTAAPRPTTTPMPTATLVPSPAPAPSPTSSPTPAPSPTPSPAATPTPSPTTPIPTPTPTPISTATPISAPIPTATP